MEHSVDSTAQYPLLPPGPQPSSNHDRHEKFGCLAFKAAKERTITDIRVTAHTVSEFELTTAGVTFLSSSPTDGQSDRNKFF